MTFADAQRAGKSTVTVDVPEAERIRFSITDDEAQELARSAVVIEQHYGRPMDIEWGRDGQDGKLYILQARPETVKSQEDTAERLRRYRLKPSPRCWRAAAPSARRSGRAACGSSSPPPKWTASRRATCWSPT